MRVTIFGASGQTGRWLVKQALQHGYLVKAFVRDKSRLSVVHPKLIAVRGDVHDPVAVSAAVKGSSAVLSALGWKRSSRKNILSQSAINIVAAMKKQNVRRIIALTGYGVRFPQDPPDSLSKRLIHFALKLYAPHLLAEGTKYACTIAESGLDWTIVRTSILSNARGRGRYKAGYFDPGLGRVAREDVAWFMVKQIEDRGYVNEAPVIAY